MRTLGSITTLCAVALAAASLLLAGAGVARAATSAFTVPAEWAGVWASTDSVYDCPVIVLDHVSASIDTLCAGQDVMYGVDTGGYDIVVDCTGTVTPTSIDVTCTGSSEVMADCTATMTLHIQGTRTGDTSVTITTMQITYSGSAFGCDLLPPMCTRTVSRSTRTGPAPSAYCTTPVTPQSWGALKVRYR